MEKSKHKMLNYINVFRALAIILIVMGHSFLHIHNRLISKFVVEFFGNGTVLFVFIAGFLFQYLQSSFEYNTYLKKKLYNVILPYIITSVVGITIYLCYPPINPFAGINTILQIPMFLSTGVHNFPTWYIIMTSFYFIMAYILLKMEHTNIFNRSLLYSLLPFFLLLSVLIVRSGDVSGLYGIDAYIANVKMILQRTIHFLSVYILGMYCSANRDKIDILYDKRKMLIIFYFIFATIDIFLGYKYGYSNITISKIIFTLICLGYLKHYDQDIISNTKLNSIADLIAKNSFGIFFIHGYLIIGLHAILKFILHLETKLTITNFSDLLYFIIVFILTMLITFSLSLFICCAIKKLLTKIGIKNTRMIIGA